MKRKLKLASLLFGIALLTAAATWLVIPQGSRIDLRPLKIQYNKEFPLKLGLDLQGGSRLIYEVDFSQVDASQRSDALAAARSTIERRVNSFGLAEAVVTPLGLDKIAIELPGVKDIDEAIKLIGQTPVLEFRTQSTETPSAQVGEDGQVTVDPLSNWKPTGLTGKQLKRATPDLQNSSSLGSGVVVRLEFNDEGKDLFAKITSENIGKPLAIFIDGQILSAPTVNSAITDGVAIISGNFSPDLAKELSVRLNSGALPVPIKLVSQQNVGATLGLESVNASALAGLIGLALIAVFMLVYYRFPGLLAVAALVIYTILSLAIFKVGISFAAVALVGLFFLLGLTVSVWFGVLALASYLLLLFLGAVAPVTLTLAGAAGFILSIGMAVDANILIFERVKEELRSGKGIQLAINDGFSRAWLSIRDSNVSSLITTAILYTLGTPSIKGFAITLSIGIFISMFTAISITRTFLKVFLGIKQLRRPWLFGVSGVGEAKD